MALLLALALAGCASTGSDGRVTAEPEHSPFLATLMAIFPGFFVHGAGNMYAGKHNRGEELLEEEGLGLGCMAIGAGLGGLGYLEHVEASKAKNTFEMVLNRMGEVSSFIGCGGFLGFGLVSFFDSWIRDMAEAGDAAESHNRDLRLREQENTVPADPNVADLTTAGAPSGSLILGHPR